MIPTVIVVNDENKYLKDLHQFLKNIVRVYYRSSLDGEKLYGIREGILYFDDNDQKQLVRKDNYTNLIPDILSRLEGTKPFDKTQLKTYLRGVGAPVLSRSILDECDDKTQAQLNAYVRDIYSDV